MGVRLNLKIKLYNTYIIISPYLLIIVLWCFITNKLKEFLICFVALLIHELGHLITAYMLKEKVAILKVLPIGFSCRFKNQSQIMDKSMIKIIIAGPAVSLLMAGLFLFWTKDFAIINLMIGLVNLFPIGELDGMRVLNLIMENKIYK